MPGGATDPPEAAGLLDKIPLSATAVLLLGCGDGALGAAFRARNPTCRLIGIEPDPTLARRAMHVLDEVYCLAAEPGPLPVLPKLDCILVAPGVVERLARPADLLADLTRRLAPEGLVVICAPPGPLHPLLAEAGLHALDAEDLPLAGFPHTVWRAATQQVPPLRLLSTMLPPVGGVSQVRVIEPMRALSAEPGIAASVVPRATKLPAPEGPPGIYILHRPALLGEEGLATVRALIARGWLVVCEFDDHPSQIPILYRSDVHNFDAVHAIQTSTPALAEVLGRENPEIAVFPNALFELPRPANFATPGRLSVLFAALNREEDWPGHMEALNDAARDAGPALHFEVIADHAFFEALATPHKSFTPLCDYETYLAILSRCEVSFMPLRDTLFNRCKSDLKFLEAAAHRAVALASPTVYAASIRDGENGMLFRTAQDLRDRLMHLAADPAAARAMAERARDDVARTRMLGGQMRERTEWYRALWARRDSLHRALLERVPALAGGQRPDAALRNR
jgi:SAM-dependent methyltransferase